MSATKQSNLVARFAVLSSHVFKVASNERLVSTPRKALGAITNQAQPSSSEQKSKTRAPTTLTTSSHGNGSGHSNEVVRTGFESSASIRRRQVSPCCDVLYHALQRIIDPDFIYSFLSSEEIFHSSDLYPLHSTVQHSLRNSAIYRLGATSMMFPVSSTQRQPLERNRHIQM